MDGETVTDLVLFSVYCLGGYLKHPYSVNNALSAAEDWLDNYNFQTIKRALQNLSQRRMLLKDKDGLSISPKGKNYLMEIMPGLNPENKRKSGEVFLITYDIVETSHYGREALRRFLNKSNVIKVQESVYLTTKDLRSEINEIVSRLKIKGAVLVAKLGQDSFFGDKTAKDYLGKYYKIEEINNEYKELLNKKPSFALTFKYNRIYKNDPHLPNEFLPDDWMGNKAYLVYFKFLTSLSPAGVLV